MSKNDEKAEALEKCKRKRTTLKAAATKIVNRINDFLESEAVEISALEECRDLLKLKENEISILNGKIEELIDLDHLEAEIELRSDYDDKLFSAMFKINKKLESLMKGVQPLQIEHETEPEAIETRSNYSNAGANATGTKKANLRLPKLVIQPYDGSHETWQEFWGHYENAIHNNDALTEIEKFTYLKSFLKDSALVAIQGLVISSSNYTTAIDILKKRFGKKELIIRAHLHKLMSLEPVKSPTNFKELRDLADVCSVQIRSLEAIGMKLETYESLLFPALLKLIPEEIVLQFHRTRKEDEAWNIDELLDFLKKEIDNREKTFMFRKKLEKEQTGNKFVTKTGYRPFYDKRNTQNSVTGKTNIPAAAALTTIIKNECLFCESKDHEAGECQELTVEQRKNILKKQGRCWRCMKRFHIISDCKTKIIPCEICKSKRHTKILCDNSVPKKSELKIENPPEKQTIVSSVSQAKNRNLENRIILQTSSVIACSGFKSEVKICLLDSASERTFVTKSLATELNLKPVRKEKLLVYAFGVRNPTEQIYEVVRLELKNKQNPKRFIQIEALVVEIISANPVTICSQNKHSRRLENHKAVAARTFSKGAVDILIGMDYFYLVNCGKVKKLAANLFESETLFGKTIQGQSTLSLRNASVLIVAVNHAQEAIKQDLNFLWEQEELVFPDGNVKSILDTEIIKQFNENLRFVNGRYESPLIWSTDKREIEDNWEIAKCRFTDLKHKLKKDRWLYENYIKIINEQLNEKIVEECSQERSETEYFLPHRPLVRKDKRTTKIRLIFDPSSKWSNKYSLNDCLSPGVNLNPNILTIILKFREHKIAFSADIEKAFLQISIAVEDRQFLKFFWFDTESRLDRKSYKILRMARVPFGISCSPFILAATIKYHINKYKVSHPEVYKMLNENFYVDDLFQGCESESQALKLSLEAVKIMKEAGMNLRKFTTNSVRLRTLWKEEEIPENEGDADNSMKVLGIIWDPKVDIFKIEIKGALESLEDLKFTKRNVLQVAAKMFDPVGFLAPFIIRIKCLMQEIWTAGLTWDEEISPEMKEKFLSWCSEIKEIENIHVNRNYYCGEVIVNKTVHIFSDASPRAYGAVAYFRYSAKEEVNCTSFIMSKARVAPLKKITLPRLELMAATVAAKLANYLKSVFKLKSEDIILWTDSSIVYHWIRGSANRWKPFVSNRVQEIQTSTIPQNWKHLKSKDNPADLITRGEKVNTVIANEFWWHGPSWLRLTENLWPQNSLRKLNEEDVNDERKHKIDAIIQLSTMTGKPTAILNIEKFSRISRMYRITAWVRRFINNCKPGSGKFAGELTASEIAEAEKSWIRVIQNEAFSKEIDDLINGKPIDKQSKLYKLCPEIDDDNLLCLKGRLEFSEFDIREKHPWILPKNKFTELIIKDAHDKVYHSGIDSTLTEVREKYWILKGRQFIKSVLKGCLICRYLKVRPGTQIEAPLPSDRIKESQPFSVTGVDFLGPVFTKGTSEKHYILLCTCAVTRAIHLEIVSNLSTETFLLAFRRFISRRGVCSTVYSDNAKTFIRANLELTKMWEVLNDSKVKEYYGSRGIQWKFISERAAWWGGFWERMVRTIKGCFRRVIRKTSFTLEELETVMIEIEATINSRPITFVYNDPQEPSPLTPAHFIIGKRLTSLPSIMLSDEKIFVNRDTLIKRYNYRERILQHFWRRWRKEYMLNLRSANMLTPIKESNSFQVNDVVLIHDERLPRNMWRMGKITEVFPGRDGKIRSCNVKTKTGTLKRPIQLLYPLELNEHCV